MGMFALKISALGYNDKVDIYSVASQLLVLVFMANYLALVVRMFKDMRNHRSQERLLHPEAFLSQVDQKDSKQCEFKSQLSLLGIPLYHFQFGRPEVDDRPAFGWILCGNQAYGLLFAWSGVAVVPISVGIVSIVVISVGASGIGLMGIGLVGIGVSALAESVLALQRLPSKPTPHFQYLHGKVLLVRVFPL